MLSWVIEEWNNKDFRFLALPTQKLGLLYFEIKEQSCSPNCSLESLFLFQILNKAKLLPYFPLSSNQAYVELRVGVKGHVCFAYIIKSKTRSKQKRVIQSDQDVQVCGMFSFFGGGWMISFAQSTSLLCFPQMCTTFLSLFFL